MKALFLMIVTFGIASGCASSAHAIDVFDLNVFDQLQGNWDSGFRARRMGAVADYVGKQKPAIVTFQEAQRAGEDSADASLLNAYTNRDYVYEMFGADNQAYGYWMGSTLAPIHWINDGFSFEGGVQRRVQGAVFEKALGKDCLGVLSLHLSYQTTEVRQEEARWLLDWLLRHESECKQWLVVGDFNADEKSAEMQLLFKAGLKSLYKELKPSIGAFNPIRRIYGDNIPSQTIDWALGWNIEGSAQIVLDSPWNGEWVSDHAGILIHVEKAAAQAYN
ncbi:MAG: endonuclease/exonuclease/phosphatase family protein [Bdellovibrionota bacterium]